jgi:predicted aspartyl protease
LVVDTGAAETIIVPAVLDELGYSPRQGEAITVMRSAVGREEGYLIRVARFACLGFHLKGFRVHAHDLPEGFDIDGLIGLSFLFALRLLPRRRGSDRLQGSRENANTRAGDAGLGSPLVC